MCVAYESWQLFLAVYFVRNRELLTAFGTTRSQNATTVSSRHALTETMLVVSLAIVGLERSFHCCFISILLLFVDQGLEPSKDNSGPFEVQS